MRVAVLLLLLAGFAIAEDMPGAGKPQWRDGILLHSIPAPITGEAEVRLKQSWRLPVPLAGDGMGAVRTTCAISHYGWDDPILLPGKPNEWWHLHMFWGNTAVTGDTTPESLLASGNGTCRGGILNRSAYWMPAVYDSVDGEVMRPGGVGVYYKTGYSFGTKADRRNDEIRPMPQGIMVATKPGKTDYYIECNRQHYATFAECAGAESIKITINLPQCWDGHRLTSEAQDHMAQSKRGCPKTHPVPLPQISYQLTFGVPEGRDPATWRVSSDMEGDAGGSTIHADWMNGWMPVRPELWVRDIINQGRDGGSHHAGNGEEWF